MPIVLRGMRQRWQNPLTTPMDPARWRRARELFDDVVALEPAERQARLRRTCDGDPELRREVESLLEHDSPAHDAIEGLLVEAAREAVESGQAESPMPAAVGRYRILATLGRGGMGEVFLAEDPILGRRVALKLPPALLSGDPETRERLWREARAAATLSHPHVCVVHELGEGPSGRPFIAMEYLEGETLSRRIRRGRLAPRELLELGIQAAGALQAAHAMGVVHRDLKPSNIMLTRHGIKLLDFGLASVARDAGGREPTAGFQGTIPYMSPEQARCEALDHRTDLFSLGVVLYEAATGLLPFQGDAPQAVGEAVLTGDPAPPSAIVRGLPAGLDRVIGRALARDRRLRYQSAGELRDDLLRLAAPSSPLLRQPRLTLAAAALAVVLAYGLATRSPAPDAGGDDTVLVAEVANATRDPTFDGTLREALVVQLQQAPLLRTLPDASLRETLRAMARSREERLTPEIAREICRRRGLKAWISGTIESQGNAYAITLLARNGRDGRILARERLEADAKVRVLPTLGEAAVRLRRELGESLPSVRKFNAPAERATTASLDALKAYALGVEQADQGNYPVAVSLYERAVQLDPEFALAHQALARERLNAGDSQEAVAAAATRAHELRARVTEQERLRIVAFYHSSVTGDLERAIEAGERWMATYPLDWRPRHVLADLYHSTGRYEKAAEAAGEAVRLEPGVAAAHSNLGGALFALDRFDEARTVYQRALARGLDAPEYHAFLWRIAYYAGDAELMRQQLDWAAASSAWAFNIPSLAAALQGRWRAALRGSRRASEFFEARGLRTFVAMAARYDAVTGALVGDCETSRRRAATTLELASQPEERARAATALALCGEAARAAELADRLQRDRPNDTLLTKVWGPLIRAACALARSQPRDAIVALEPAAGYEGAAESWPVYMRGIAMLRAGDAAGARAEFRKIVSRRGRAFWVPFHPLAHLGLARAATMTGDIGPARDAYRELFALWKDADVDLPVLVEARREYDALRSRETR